MNEPTDPTATSSDEQPVETPTQLGNDGLNGQMLRELQEQLDARVKPLLQPEQPEHDPRLDDLSEDDRDLLAERERQYTEQLEELNLRNQLLEISRERPREGAILERLLQAESLSDMAAALSEAFGQPDPEAEVADVDRNNPSATPLSYAAGADMIRLPDGQLLTREQGLEVLRNADSLHG